jgi:predicted PurR-regulated permease PerM
MNGTEQPMQSLTPSKIVLLALVAGISIIFLAMIKTFLMAVLLAGIFSSLAQPMYQRIKARVGDRPQLGSIITLGFIILLIVIPMVLLLGVVTGQAIKVGEAVTPWVTQKLNNPDEIIVWLHNQAFYNNIEPYQDDILTKAGEMVGFMSRFLINNLSNATAGTLNFFFMLFVMLYSMFFFLVDGSKIIDRMLYYLPLEDKDERRLLEKFSSVTRATIKGTAVIGVLQGGMAGMAFFAVGIPSSIFWATLMMVLSIIPGIGTGLVWVPAVIILIAGGSVGKGIGLAIFCGLVVGSVDNFVRPRLVGKDTQLPDLMILLSTMGGLIYFGILGIIIGPIVAALFVTIWEIYGVAFQDTLPPSSRFHPEGCVLGCDDDEDDTNEEGGDDPSSSDADESDDTVI